MEHDFSAVWKQDDEVAKPLSNNEFPVYHFHVCIIEKFIKLPRYFLFIKR